MSEPWDLPPDHPEAKPSDSGPVPTPPDTPTSPDADTPPEVDQPTEHLQQHQGAPHSAPEPPQGEPATEHIPQQQAQPTQHVNRRSAYSEPPTQITEPPERRQQTQRQPVQPSPQPAPYLQSPPAQQQGFNDHQGQPGQSQYQGHPGQPHYQQPPGHYPGAAQPVKKKSMKVGAFSLLFVILGELGIVIAFGMQLNSATTSLDWESFQYGATSASIVLGVGFLLWLIGLIMSIAGMCSGRGRAFAAIANVFAWLPSLLVLLGVVGAALGISALMTFADF